MPATEGHDAQPADEQQLLGEVESMSLSQNRENITQNNTAPNNGAQSGAHCSADEEEPIFRPNIRRLIETESDPEDESQRPTINVVIDEDVDDTDEQHLSEEAGGSTAHTNGLPEHQDHDYALVGDTQLRGSIKDTSEPPIPTIPPLEEYFSEHAAQDQIIPAEVKYVSSRHTDAHRHGINLASYRPAQTQPTRIITRQPIGSPQQAYRPRDFTSSSQERRTTLVPANAASLMPRRSVEVHHRRSLEETPRSLPPSNLRRPLGVEGRLVPASSTPSVEPARPVNANQHAPFIVPASGPKYMNRSRTVRQRADQSGAASGAYVHYDHPGPRKSDSPAKSHESPTRPHTSPYHQFSSPAQPTPESTLIDVVQEEEEQNAKFFQQQQRHHLLKGLGGAKVVATSATSSLGQQSQAAQQEPAGNAVEQIPTATSGTTLTTLTQEQPVDSAITSPPSHLRPYEARARTVSETAAPLGQQVPQYAADSSQSPQQQDVYSRPTIMRNRQPASSSGYPATNVRVEVPISGGMTQSVTAQPMDDGMRQLQRDFGEHRRAATGLSPQRGVPRYEYYDSPRSSGGSPQMRQQHLMEERQRPMAYNDQQGAPADEFAHRVSRSGLAELAHASQITQRHISSPPRYAEETPAYRQPLAYASPERAGNFIQEADSSGGLGHQPHEYQPGRRAHKRVQSPAQQDAAQEPRSAADSTEARPRRRGRRPTHEVNEEAKKEEEWGDYTTRCLCGLEHNDPFMIMCDACSVWQHGLCMGVDEKHVPEQYYCELCAPRKLKNDPAKARAMQEELLERVRKHADSQKKGSRGRKSAGVTKSRRMSKEDHRERAASRNESRVSSHSSTGAEQQVENKLSRSLRIFVNSHQHHDKGDVHLLDALVRDATKELIVAPAIKGLVATKKGGFQAGEPITEYRAHLHFVTDNPERFNVAPKNGLIYRGLGDDEKLAIYADASKASSEARSARRSCQPNAKIRHAIKDGRLHLLLVATEPIDETEEITIPFEKEYQLSSTPVSCACGATDNADPASCQSKACPIRAFNENLSSGKLLPNGNDQHAAAEGGTPKRRGLITVGPSHTPKTTHGPTGRGKPGRPRKNESPERTPPARRVGPFKTGSRYLESTERKKTPQDDKETKESTPPTRIAPQRRGSESANAESISQSSSPKPEPRRSNRSRGTSSSMQTPQMMVTETVPEPAPKPEEEDKPSIVKSPPPVVSVDQTKSELPAISPREARKLQQEEKLFEKIEQQQKRKETHKHPGEKPTSSESQKAAAAGSQNRPNRRSAQSDASEEPTTKRGKTSIASEAKRRFSISEEQESKKGGKKAKVVNTQPAPEKIVAATALPPSQMVTPSRRLRTNTRTEPAAMEVDDHKPASSTPRVDLRAKGGDGAALKRQISQQEAAHVLAEMARNHSPPTTSSPLQLDMGSSQNAPLYPRISPTAETRGLGAMLCRLAVASGAVNQNDFNLPQGFPSAPVIKVPEVPPPAKQVKKISIAEYKSRRGTMTSASGTSPSTQSTDLSSSPRARPAQPAKRQSFIPNIADTSAFTVPLEVTVPASLDDLKKRILTTTSGTYLGTSPSKEPADSPSVSMTATADSTTGEPTPSGSATRSAGSAENNVVSSTTPTPTEPRPAPIRAVSASGGQRPSLEDRLKTVFGLDVKAKAQPPPEPAPLARRFSQRKFEDRSREAVPPPRQLPTCPVPADRQLHADNAQVGPGLQSAGRR